MGIPERARALFQEHYAFLCIFCLALGVFSGSRAGDLFPVVPWLMALLMFSSGLGLRLRDLETLGRRPWLLPVILLLFHIVFPLAWAGIGRLFGFPPEVVMGFAILAILPVSASCVIWMTFYRSNVTLGMAVLLVDTLVAPFIIPYVLAFLFGANVQLDPFQMLQSLFWMLFFPTFMALLCNRLSHGNLERVAGKPLAVGAKLAILAILWVNGGAVSPYCRDLSFTLLLICGMTLCLVALLFAATFLLGCLLFTRKEDVIALMLCSIRATTAGIVIAMAYFPPLTTFTVVLNMLFQQPMGAWAGKRALRYLENKERKKAAPDAD